MGCDPKLYKKEYDFFKNINQYIEYDELAENNGTSDISDLDYGFINSFDADKFDDLKILCNKFIYLVVELYKRNGGNTFNDNNDFDYLNYWLNARLREINPENICTKFFFQNLRSKLNGNQYLRKLKSSIYDIEEYVLINMNSIYTLYKFYNEINKIINGEVSNKENIINIANKCVLEYKKIKDVCPTNDTHFCKTLKNFKEKYEEINLCKYNFSKWRKEKLPSLTKDSDESLPDCETTVKEVDRETEQGYSGSPEPAESHSDMDVHSITIGIVTTLAISFIYFIFYKFTSFGSLIRSRIVKEGKKSRNLDVDIDHFSHTSEYEHVNSGSTSYNIAFNSVV